jgi:hypothetical protein
MDDSHSPKPESMPDDLPKVKLQLDRIITEVDYLTKLNRRMNEQISDIQLQNMGSGYVLFSHLVRNNIIQITSLYQSNLLTLDSELQRVRDQLSRLRGMLDDSSLSIAGDRRQEAADAKERRQELAIPEAREKESRPVELHYDIQDRLLPVEPHVIDELNKLMAAALDDINAQPENRQNRPLLASAGQGLPRPGISSQAPEEISIVIYIDTDSDADIARVVQRTDEFVDVLGYEGPIEPIIERGSFFRRSWAKIRKTATSSEAREIAAKAGRAIEMRYLDSEQADIDQKVAEAQASLIDSLADISNACIRAGSILLIKYTGTNGPVVFTRNLSQLEISILEKYPEIQRTPQTALDALALAMSEMHEAEQQQHQQ